MSEEIGNQTEESQVEIERDADTEALYESFGMAAQKAEKKDVEFPKMEEPTEPLTTEEEEEEIQEDPPAPTDKRTLKLKYNGEDKEVDEEEARTLAQKGLNYDKVQQKLNEQQKALDEVARMQGFKDHAELIAELPKLREQQQQKEIDQFEQTKQKIIDDLVYNGVDEQAAREYAENNPLVQQAKAALGDKQQANQERDQQAAKQQWLAGWAQLYETFTETAEDAKAWDRDERPSFFTEEMESMVNSGYKPLDAYRLAHMDKIQAQSNKSSEQKLIKQQQLGLRGHVNEQTATPPDEGSVLPVHYGLAEEFGVSVKGIQRQNQLLKTRR